ncbi:MAG: hypothetical protein HY336_00795, partial [Candidatus Doudnabacteria bacterium]|nr:hypothetical protein [Candidatus Doudnabacteria bacterium]
MKQKSAYLIFFTVLLIFGSFLFWPKLTSASVSGGGDEVGSPTWSPPSGSTYTFNYGCHVGGATADCERAFSFYNGLGQVYKADYLNVQNDFPTPNVYWCINNTGTMGSGYCSTIQDQNSGNQQLDDISLATLADTAQYRYLVIRIRVEGTIFNDNDFEGKFTMYRRWAQIKSFSTSTPNLSSGSRAKLSWDTEHTTPSNERIITMTRPNGSSTSWNGKDNATWITEDKTDWVVPEDLTQTGTYTFSMQVGGPSQDNGFKRISAADVTVQVASSAAPISGTLRSTIPGSSSNTTCTKSGSFKCDVVLDYTTTGATTARIKRNGINWTDITTNVPAGTVKDSDPATGTISYELYGYRSGWAGETFIKSVTVTINPEPGVPITCSPASQNVALNALASFTANGGSSYSWSAPGGTPASGTAASFATKYASTGSKTVTVTSGGSSAACSVSVTQTAQSGTVKIRVKKDNTAWSGNIKINYQYPGGTNNNFSVPAPEDYANSAVGTYTVSYVSGGPANTTLSSITPSATQSLANNGTITFTFNFATNSGNNNAAYVSQSVPASLTCGQTSAVSVTMRNSGTKSWTTPG